MSVGDQISRFGFVQDRLEEQRRHVDGQLVIASGAVTSGLGYVVWYAALPGLTVTRAAMVQLCVPVVAPLGGVVFLAEVISLRLLVSAAVILGGVSTAVMSRAGDTASSK